jgi:hypothetical protein
MASHFNEDAANASFSVSPLKKGKRENARKVLETTNKETGLDASLKPSQLFQFFFSHSSAFSPPLFQEKPPFAPWCFWARPFAAGNNAQCGSSGDECMS